MSQNSDSSILYKDEFHFKNIRQITFGGSNAEAYWNFDDLRLCFQANHAG